MESYRIIMDKDGLVTDYLLAVYAVVREWSELRSSVQDLWHEVAYDGLNSAVAASLSNVAVTMVKQTCFAVFADFPDHDSYDTIIKTLTRGDPDKAQGQFSMSLYRTSPDGQFSEKVQDTPIDIKEQFWVHTYDDLVLFITDFQKNRNGKPTKALQAQLNGWDPNFDLQKATKEKRIRWRRSYTINWLFDLVNVFSSIVVQRNTMKGEHHVFELVDWGKTGPWHMHRRFFGLNDFAAFVTTLAMQKPSTDIRQKILPYHVFQLQCVVDSFTASRGWMLSPLRGHVLEPPAADFRPRRDVDLFLDREGKGERQGRGFIQAVYVLKQMLEKDAERHQDPNRHQATFPVLEDLQYDFVNWLGESKYMYGLKTLPPSRFSKHHANGLWEYSPLLCGAGLVEGLILQQRIVMLMWDKQLSEPTLAVHLHNMLVKKGYLEKVGIYTALEGFLKESFFPNDVPDSRFYDTLMKLISGPNNRTQAQTVARDETRDTHQLLDVRLNKIFKTKSALTMYHDADWAPEKIPDNDIRIPSLLYVVRLGEVKRTTDPISGKVTLDETPLVKRAKALGQDDAALLQGASIFQTLEASDPLANIDKTALFNHVSSGKYKDYTAGPDMNPYNVCETKTSQQKITQGTDLLDLIRVDIFHDVCGNHPLSALNYVWLTVHIMMLFLEIEDALQRARHPLYVKAYEQAPASMRRTRRAGLIMAALADEDEAALKIFAEAFEKLRMGAMGCIYWEDLREEESGVKPSKGIGGDEVPVDQCCAM